MRVAEQFLSSWGPVTPLLLGPGSWRAVVEGMPAVSVACVVCPVPSRELWGTHYGYHVTHSVSSLQEAVTMTHTAWFLRDRPGGPSLFTGAAGPGSWVRDHAGQPEGDRAPVPAR